jgi:hypothetical protein
MTVRLPISFKCALTRFKALCDSVIPEAGELDSADQGHLARWADDDRAEKVWQKIQNLAWGPIASYDPLEGFIVSVLVARRMANTVHLSEHIRERQKKLRARHLDRARQLEELAKVWKEIGQSNHAKAALALQRATRHEEEAQLWRRLSDKPPRRRLFHVSRVDRSGSRQERAFMQLMGKYIIDLCGRPLDSEVAILNDIAFDTQEPTSAFRARSARRPTTRKGRLKRNVPKARQISVRQKS